MYAMCTVCDRLVGLGESVGNKMWHGFGGNDGHYFEIDRAKTYDTLELALASKDATHSVST